MKTIWAQARFPAPEFENYTLPEMNLESTVHDPTFQRVIVLVIFLVISAICFYGLRSRKLMLAIAVAGFVVFGYVFTACPCPVGMFQNIAESASIGIPVPLGVLLLFAIPLAFTLFFGRLFCAGACPLGAIQELLHWKTVNVPRPLDRVLRMLPILLFVIITVMAVSGMGFMLCRYDPYLPLFLLNFPMPFTLITLAFLLLGLFVARPFCRYFCPYGVLLRFFALFSLMKPQITVKPCINCKLCEQGCPNGAILSPEHSPTPEVQLIGARRLSFIVALTPFILCVGGTLGFVASPIITAMHQDVRLLRQIQAKEQTLEVEAFESFGTSLAVLEQRVVNAQNTITVGMCLAGIVFAGCVMTELITETRRRKEEDKYDIDGSLCFCCGRCYQTCPLETKRKKVSSR